MSYSTLNFPGAIDGSKTLLTGIRRKKHSTIITGFYEVNGENVSFVQSGNGYHILNYYSYVTNLYGPCFLKNKRYRFVGNIIGVGSRLIGCYYEGKLDGKGEWRLLERGRNTICHSTMGNLIVGNGQEGELSSAFIYDICDNKYINIEKRGARSITAYGIWHNKKKDCHKKKDKKDCHKKKDDNKHSYTICGGYSPMVGIHTTIGYTVDYNSKTKKFSNWQDYYYNNDAIRSTATHFNGITAGEHGGHNLTGVAVHDGEEVAFFLSTSKKHHHHHHHNPCVVIDSKDEHIIHSDNLWREIKYPESYKTTGNSVVDKTVIGVYIIGGGNDTVNGFIVNLH